MTESDCTTYPPIFQYGSHTIDLSYNGFHLASTSCVGIHAEYMVTRHFGPTDRLTEKIRYIMSLSIDNPNHFDNVGIIIYTKRVNIRFAKFVSERHKEVIFSHIGKYQLTHARLRFTQEHIGHASYNLTWKKV
jgi:hypothetical protein